jgi:hypothetical protein
MKEALQGYLSQDLADAIQQSSCTLKNKAVVRKTYINDELIKRMGKPA